MKHDIDFAEVYNEVVNRFLTSEQLARIKKENSDFFSREKAKERAVEYLKKVHQLGNHAEEKKEQALTIVEMTKYIAEQFPKFIAWKNAKSGNSSTQAPKDFSELPAFQRKAIKAMCMTHLGYMPKNCEGLEMNKSLYLMGDTQIGKTTVFEFLKYIPDFKYKIVSSYQLSRLVTKNGDDYVMNKYKDDEFLLIDELGMEQPARHYGKWLDFVPELIHARHELGNKTHFTSNIAPSDLRYQRHIIARVLRYSNVIFCDSQPLIDI